MNNLSLPDSVDDVEEAMKLVNRIKEHLPIKIRPTSALVKVLRKKHIYLDRYKPLEIRDVHYLGNEAGIACEIAPPGGENTLISSLTQLEILETEPLAEEMKAYQEERIKTLKRIQGNQGPTSLTFRR